MSKEWGTWQGYSSGDFRLNGQKVLVKVVIWLVLCYHFFDENISKILLKDFNEKKAVRIVLKNQWFFGLKQVMGKGAGGVKTVSVLLFGRTPKPVTEVSWNSGFPVF